MIEWASRQGSSRQSLCDAATIAENSTFVVSVVVDMKEVSEHSAIRAQKLAQTLANGILGLPLPTTQLLVNDFFTRQRKALPNEWLCELAAVAVVISRRTGEHHQCITIGDVLVTISDHVAGAIHKSMPHRIENTRTLYSAFKRKRIHQIDFKDVYCAVLPRVVIQTDGYWEQCQDDDSSELRLTWPLAQVNATFQFNSTELGNVTIVN